MRIFLLSIAVASLCFAFASQAQAAQVILEGSSATVTVGDVISVTMLLDTELQKINAAEADVVFPEDFLQFIGVRDSDSVLNFWVSEPSYKGNGVVHFSGITPGGFVAPKANLIELLFKVIEVGEGEVHISNASVLLHDGLGTRASLTVSPFLFASDAAEPPSVDASAHEDDELPEAFAVELQKDADVFEGNHFLIFATEDKGSGMHHFEVKEGILGRYTVAKSPYQLKDQSLTKKIFVKAVDSKGNERVTVFYPQNIQSSNQNNSAILSILILCVLTLLWGWKRMWFFRK